ncbi:MAG: PhaM family polyhydroxyalkanoate granule multifunctional regulatory protein [Casimicrobiaceae bacterium]
MSKQPTMPLTPQEAMAFMQRMWNPFGVPVPGFAPPGGSGDAVAGIPFPNPAAMLATLDPAEIDKKIAELRVIENWLAMSQNFMQMSIKTMELQKSSLEAMRAAAAAAAPEPSKKKSPSKTEGV